MLYDLSEPSWVGLSLKILLRWLSERDLPVSERVPNACLEAKGMWNLLRTCTRNQIANYSLPLIMTDRGVVILNRSWVWTSQ